jgi:hypothetical protein
MDYGHVCKANIGPSGEDFPAFLGVGGVGNYSIQHSQQPTAGFCPDLNESLLFILFLSYIF